MNTGNTPLDSLLAELDDKEMAIQCDNDEDKDDDDDEDLDFEVFEQGRSGSSDRSTEFELDSRERLQNHLERKRKNSRRYCSLALLKKRRELKAAI